MFAQKRRLQKSDLEYQKVLVAFSQAGFVFLFLFGNRPPGLLMMKEDNSLFCTFSDIHLFQVMSRVVREELNF